MNDNWQSTFAKDASLFPHLADFQKDQVLLSTMSETAYRQASFLDQRLFTPDLERQIVTWGEIAALPLPALEKPHYIFHIGHVGSTLLSRLLGELDSVLALREPAILRQLAEIQVNGQGESGWSGKELAKRLGQLEHWLSRVFHPRQRVMIKASSFVSPLARALLDDKGKALFLYAPIDRYLKTILAGDASKQEAAALVENRLSRLAAHCGEPLAQGAELSLAQTAILGWLCEMVTLADTSSHTADASVCWMDFDDFLQDPAVKLKQAASHFGLELDPARAEVLTAGPIMTRYSKAPEYDYSVSLREELLAEAAQIHADDIRQTLLWVEKLAGRYPIIADALAIAETRR